MRLPDKLWTIVVATTAFRKIFRDEARLGQLNGHNKTRKVLVAGGVHNSFSCKQVISADCSVGYSASTRDKKH